MAGACGRGYRILEFGNKPNRSYPAFPRAASTLHIPAPRAAI
jgi:hypothetical protein